MICLGGGGGGGGVLQNTEDAPDWIMLRYAHLAVLPRSLTSLCLRGEVKVSDDAWASVPSGLQLCTLDLYECTWASWPSPFPQCMPSLTCLHFQSWAQHVHNFDIADLVVRCPMLQQLKLMFDSGRHVASWEPLTCLASLRDLTIEAAFRISGHDADVPCKAYPPFDLDRSPPLESFSGQHFAGVKGHVHGTYFKTGYVESISLMRRFCVTEQFLWR